MYMRTILALVVVCSSLALTPRVHADEKSHRAAVLELCSVMKVETLMQEAMQRMIDMQIQQVPAMQGMRGKIEQFFGKYLSWKALQEDFVKMYMEAFSEAELRELVAFYKTPTGQKAVRQMPSLMQRGAEIGAGRMRDHMGELRDLLSSSAPAGDTKPAPAKAQPAAATPIH
jgi:hypothetical protein